MKDESPSGSQDLNLELEFEKNLRLYSRIELDYALIDINKSLGVFMLTSLVYTE